MVVVVVVVVVMDMWFRIRQQTFTKTYTPVYFCLFIAHTCLFSSSYLKLFAQSSYMKRVSLDPCKQFHKPIRSFPRCLEFCV
jgi:hypothetical protein